MHHIKGRNRIHCRALYYLKEFEQDILSKVGKLYYVRQVKISIITANILVHYDPGDINPDLIPGNIEEIISLFSIPAYKRERKEKSRITVNERRLQEEPVNKLLVNVIAGAVSLAFALLTKKGKAGSTSIPERLFGFTALSSISLSMPILKSGFESPQEGEGILLEINKTKDGEKQSYYEVNVAKLDTKGNYMDFLNIIAETEHKMSEAGKTK